MKSELRPFAEEQKQVSTNRPFTKTTSKGNSSRRPYLKGRSKIQEGMMSKGNYKHGAKSKY